MAAVIALADGATDWTAGTLLTGCIVGAYCPGPATGLANRYPLTGCVYPIITGTVAVGGFTATVLHPA